MMSWNTIGFFDRSAVSIPMLRDLRLKASGPEKPSGFASFTPFNWTRVFVDLPKSVTTNESNSNRPLHTCDFRFFTSSRSSTTGAPDDSTFSFSSFFASFFSIGFSFAPPSLASSGSSMRVKLSTFFSSKT